MIIKTNRPDGDIDMQMLGIEEAATVKAAMIDALRSVGSPEEVLHQIEHGNLVVEVKPG